MEREEMLQELYRRFNDRDIDGVLSGMTENVDWPNGWEGGQVHGKTAVREYWERQWEVIDPTVKPIGMIELGDGRVQVSVHQVVRNTTGAVMADAVVVHTYTFDGSLVSRMDIES
ncbi:MAG: nuclear transport factor 2 family protein [Armatimonadetes bacterium]|nr:nuclear transport factor 2 family protein [Armatimonadota bacterium]MBS1728125.1 nuclear transport factor 2 family protein [Armatimonadota bacterium]